MKKIALIFTRRVSRCCATAIWLLTQSGWSFGPRRGVAVSNTVDGDGDTTEVI